MHFARKSQISYAIRGAEKNGVKWGTEGPAYRGGLGKNVYL